MPLVGQGWAWAASLWAFCLRVHRVGPSIGVVGSPPRQLAWEMLRDLYRPPLTGKLHFPKEFYLYFQNQELWYMFSRCFQPRVFNLAIKSHSSRVSTFLSPKHQL